jgi:small nuclear ribonucleoprotein (snRNP)-like protein
MAALLLLHTLSLEARPMPGRPTAEGQQQSHKQESKIKAAVQKRGAGEKSRVRVTLSNNTEVSGYISKIDETSFVVTDVKTGQGAPIPYNGVQKVRGPALSKGAKIGITVAVCVGIAAIAAGIFAAHAVHHLGPS